MRLIRTQILLEEGQREFAKREAVKRDMSLSKFIRIVLDKAISRKKDETPADVLERMEKNAVKGLPKDLSTNDDYLYGNKDL